MTFNLLGHQIDAGLKGNDALIVQMQQASQAGQSWEEFFPTLVKMPHWQLMKLLGHKFEGPDGRPIRRRLLADTLFAGAPETLRLRVRHLTEVRQVGHISARIRQLLPLLAVVFLPGSRRRSFDRPVQPLGTGLTLVAHFRHAMSAFGATFDAFPRPTLQLPLRGYKAQLDADSSCVLLGTPESNELSKDFWPVPAVGSGGHILDAGNVAVFEAALALVDAILSAEHFRRISRQLAAVAHKFSVSVGELVDSPARFIKDGRAASDLAYQARLQGHLQRNFRFVGDQPVLPQYWVGFPAGHALLPQFVSRDTDILQDPMWVYVRQEAISAREDASEIMNTPGLRFVEDYRHLRDLGSHCEYRGRRVQVFESATAGEPVRLLFEGGEEVRLGREEFMRDVRFSLVPQVLDLRNRVRDRNIEPGDLEFPALGCISDFTGIREAYLPRQRQTKATVADTAIVELTSEQEVTAESAV